MYCKKCGIKLGEGAKFCKACGTRAEMPVTPGREPVKEVPSQQTKSKKKKKAGIVFLFLMALLACAAGAGFYTYQSFFAEEEPERRTESGKIDPVSPAAQEPTFQPVSPKTTETPLPIVSQEPLGMVTNITINSEIQDKIGFEVSWDSVERADGYEVIAYVKPSETSQESEWQNVYSQRVAENSCMIVTEATQLYGIRVCVKAFVYDGNECIYGMEGQSSMSNTFTAENGGNLVEPMESPDPDIMVQTNTNEYIFPDSDKRYLRKKDFKGMSFKEINLAKNELYARHGYAFKKGGVARKYFDSKPWYHPTVSSKEFATKGDGYYFNKYEIANRNLLVKQEKKLRK